MTDVERGPATWPAFAREVIEFTLRKRDAAQIEPPPDVAPSHGGVFVTLRKLRRLRGCMGTLDATQPLTEAARSAAVNAALHDPRFPPVGLTELCDVTIEVSIMSAPYAMRTLDDLEIGKHGILVRRGSARGMFLPQVATEHGFDKEVFLTRCCTEKAGLSPDAWRNPDTEVLLFTTDVTSDAFDEL